MRRKETSDCEDCGEGISKIISPERKKKPPPVSNIPEVDELEPYFQGDVFHQQPPISRQDQVAWRRSEAECRRPSSWTRPGGPEGGW